MIGAAAGYLLVEPDPSWFDSFVPVELADGRDFSASAEFLRGTLYRSAARERARASSPTFLFTHNAQVAMLCFALGFAFGVPTAMLLIYNGAMLGAIFALYASHGLEAELGGWIIIHGSTELFAIILAGAAGLQDRLVRGLPGRAQPARRRRRSRAHRRVGDGRRGGDAASSPACSKASAAS